MILPKGMGGFLLMVNGVLSFTAFEDFNLPEICGAAIELFRFGCHARTAWIYAALNATNPRSRSALRSSTCSSPIWSRSVGPPGAHSVAVR
jgi:hypothetical protein